MRPCVLVAAIAATSFSEGKPCHPQKPLEVSHPVSSQAAYKPDPAAIIEHKDPESDEALDAPTTTTAKQSEPASETAAGSSNPSQQPAANGGSNGLSTPLSAETRKVTSTFYPGNLHGGTCSFRTYTMPSHLYGVALSVEGWDPNNCGACIEITGPKENKITAMVVDQCGSCESNQIDLFRDAFAALDNPDRGIIPVSYVFVPCGISSNMVLKNNQGTSPYWSSMNVVNSNVPVASLELSTDGGAFWQSTSRTFDNFFQPDVKLGVSSVDVRITSVTGKEVVVNGVGFAPDSETDCGSNF